MQKTQNLSRWHKVGIIFTLSLALAIIILDGTILNVSFGYILRDFNADIQKLQWVITAYSLTIAALTLTGGRLGDLFGRKKMFIIGAILFAIGSFIASISQNTFQMIVGESIIEGVGAALMMPATASLLTSTFHGQSRAIAMGIWGGVAGAAAAIGPVIGGYLTSNYSWRWGFRINVFVVLILLIGSFLIKEYRDKIEKKELDIVGVLLSATGLTALVFGFIESSTYGWIKAKEIFSIAGHNLDFGNISVVLPSLIIGVILLAIFVFWEINHEKRGHTPIVSMKIFANRQFSAGTLTLSAMALGQSGLIFSIPVFFQAVQGLDSYHTGLALMPGSIAALITAPLAALLVKKISPKILIQAGIFINGLAIFLMYRIFNVNSTTQDFIFPMIIYGIGMGMVMAQGNNLVMSAVTTEKAGEASGVNSTIRQIGATLGSAIIGAVLIAALATNIATGIKNSDTIPSQMKDMVQEKVSSESSKIQFSGDVNLPATIPATIKNEIIQVVHQATTDSAKNSLLYADIFLALGFIISFFLPSRKAIMESIKR